MKKFYSTVLFVVLVSSCTTNVVNEKKLYSDTKLKLENKYTFFLQNNTRQKLVISKIDSLYIYGKDEQLNPKTIEKTNIVKVTKANSIGTTGIIIGVAAAAIIIPAYSSNKPVGQ